MTVDLQMELRNAAMSANLFVGGCLKYPEAEVERLRKLFLTADMFVGGWSRPGGQESLDRLSGPQGGLLLLAVLTDEDRKRRATITYVPNPIARKVRGRRHNHQPSPVVDVWVRGRLKSHSVPTGPIEAVELLRSAKARALAL